MSRLQIALDELSLEQSIALCEQVRDSIDIIEIGTPFIIREGMQAVRTLRAHFPEKQLLADAKIMDAGELEARDCFEAGADYVTVLAVTDDSTIRACVKTAESYNRWMVADMICIENQGKRVCELESMGVTDIAVHTGVDMQAQGRTPLADLMEIKKCAKTAHISVAGGINEHTVDQYLNEGADIVIVGGGIAHADSPAAAASVLAAKVHR